MPLIKRWLGLLLGGSLAFLILTGCDVARLARFQLSMIDLERFDSQEEIRQEIPYSGQRIMLESLAGKVFIEGIEATVSPFVSLTALRRARGMKLEEITLTIEQDPDEIRLRADLPGEIRHTLTVFPPGLEDHVGWVEFTLKVPQDAKLILNQEIGTIQVSQFRGELEASIQLGEISVSDSTFTELRLTSQLGGLSVRKTFADELYLSTEWGDLELSDISSSYARLSTQMGSISLSGIRGGGLMASTQMGEISILKAQLKRVDLESQTGEIHLEALALHEGEIRTQLGEIRLELPRTASLKIEATTKVGEIKLRGLEPKAVQAQAQWGGSWPGQTLTLTLGSGQGRLELSTQLGEIRIRLVESKEF